MAIMLTLDQIPAFWEAIKFSTVNADQVEEEFRGKYFNRLLYQLLSGKAQCFVELDESRRLRVLAVTKIMTDEIRDESSLMVSCIYSFEKRDISDWINDLGPIYKFAKKNKCKIITCLTTNDKAARLCEGIGLKQRFKSYIMEVI